MIEIRETELFSDWLKALKDARAKAKIAARIRRLAMGNPGDVEPIGNGLSELRIHHGPGYRVYFQQRGDVLIILLCGGTKGTQLKDIAKAKLMAAELEKKRP